MRGQWLVLAELHGVSLYNTAEPAQIARRRRDVMIGKRSGRRLFATTGPVATPCMTGPPDDQLSDLLAPHERPRPTWVRALCIAGAVVFFLLGIVGWLVPVVTGVPFYLVSLALLGLASDRILLWVNRQERKLPHRWRTELRRALGKLPPTIRRHIRLRQDLQG